MLPMAAPPKKLRSSNLTHEQKRLICIHAKQNPTCTQAQLGQWAKDQFDLPTVPSQSSISHTLKRKSNFEHMRSEELASKRMRTVKFPELDTALADWFLYCQAKQIKIQGDEIKARAHAFFDLMGIQTAEPPQFSNGWLHSFQSRHGFSRSPNTQGGELDMITGRNDLLLAVEGVAPWDIYWMDETRLFYAMSPDRAPQNELTKPPPQRQLTAMLCTNADASDMLDPFFILPEPLEITEEVQVGFQYACNKKTWATATIFREWLLALDWKMHEENRQIVLLLDSFSSHQVKKMMLKNITIRFVAATSTGESYLDTLQTGIFTALKRRYRHLFLDHVLDNRDEGREDIYDVDPLHAVQWLVRCWRQLPKALVVETFACIGIPMQMAVMSDAQIEDSLDAQIVALLKRLKLKSPMKLNEFIYPAAEKVVDEELTDQDFVDCAIGAMLGTTVVESASEAPKKNARGPRPKKAGLAAMQANMKTIRRTGAQRFNSDSRLIDPSDVRGDTIPDDEWHTWASQQSPTADDVQALQTVLRLAGEMNCEPSTLLDLNRMLAEKLQGKLTTTTTTNPDTGKEEPLQTSGVCRFTFGASNKKVVI